MEERIAKIAGTFLGVEDHGIFTATLSFDYGGAGQGSPAYFLAGAGEATDPRGIDFIRGVLTACGVRQWEDVKGRTVLVVIKDGLVAGIKPLPTERGEAFLFESLYPPQVPA